MKKNDLTRPVELDESWSHVMSQTSAVTTAWGVQWDEASIARDLMQNFFDANREQIGDVKVSVKRHLVEVVAPAVFNLERLFYLGSEKGEDDIGKYGEGFKAASLCLVRDHGIEPLVISGRSAVRIRNSEHAVKDTELVPLVYDFFSRDQEIPGTRLILSGASPKLAKAMSEGLDHFFHDRNPLVGKLLWNSYRNDAALYEAKASDGAIFYRRLKRGVIEGIPVIIAIDREFASIEKKTKQDRDRHAFGKELLEAFYKAFASSVGKHDTVSRVAVIERSRPFWQSGHPLIRCLCENLAWGGVELPEDELVRLFGDKYFASVPRNYLPADNVVKVGATEDRWVGEGRLALPYYFSRLGVVDAVKYQKRLEAETVRKARRSLTEAEVGAVEVLKDISRRFAPEIMQFFEGYKAPGGNAGRKGRVTYSVARDASILGAFRRSRSYDSTEVCLVEEVFVRDFPEAIATFLHEHAHIFGYDGSRAFTDALTHIIGTVIRLRAGLDNYERDWEAARDRVHLERRGVPTANADIEGRLASMSEDGLRRLLSKIPPAVVENAMEPDEDEES